MIGREKASVTPELFRAVADWALAGGVEVQDADAESWNDAPDSNWRYGVRALESPARWHRLSFRLLDAWRAATGGTYRPATQYSDRTGEHSALALAH